MKTQGNDRNILIIGGSGFVSGTLARAALTAGWNVWTVTRGKRAPVPGAQNLIADRHDTAGFEQVIKSAGQHWNLVVDCIGYQPNDLRQDIALFRGRADQFIFISTDFVFDPAHRKFPQPEKASHYATTGYGGDKRLCELELVNADTGGMAWSIVRPCHIYGPGSQLGCLPLHGRDAKLLERLRAGTPLQLVGGGHFLQQPIFAQDLAALILSLAGNKKAYGQIFCAAGPDVIESREYYRIIAGLLGVELRIEEISVADHLAAQPESAPFLCHRVYDLGALRAAGAKVPGTPIEQGLRAHVKSLLDPHPT